MFTRVLLPEWPNWFRNRSIPSSKNFQSFFGINFFLCMKSQTTHNIRCERLAALLGSMVHRKCKSDAFHSNSNNISRTIILQDYWPMSYPGRHCAQPCNALSSSSTEGAYLTNFNTGWDWHYSLNTRLPILRLLLFIHPYSLTSAVQSNNSSWYATDASISGIAESRVPADQPEPASPFHTATYRRTNLLPPSRRIAGSDMPIHHMKAATMEPQFSIGEPDVQDALSPFSMHADWAGYSKTKHCLEHAAESNCY